MRVNFGWTEDPMVKENMNGVSGIAFGPGTLELKFNTDVKTWKKAIEGTAAHEFGHTFFFEKRGFKHDDNRPLWVYVLNEALAQNLAEMAVPEAPEPWREKFSVDEIAEYWPEIKEDLDRDYEFPEPMYINPSEGGYPNWLGYSLSYQIGKALLKEHDIEELPELERSDVVETGDRIFS